MRNKIIIAAMALVSALFLTNCTKLEEKNGKYYGFSEKEFGEIIVVGESVSDMTTTGTSFVQALQAITGKQPTPYYKDTVRMRGDMRCVVRSYDNANIQGVVHLWEGDEFQVKMGLGTAVDEFKFEFAEEYKCILPEDLDENLSQKPDYAFKYTFTFSTQDTLVCDSFEPYKPGAIAIGGGDAQEEGQKVFCFGLIKSIIPIADVTGGDNTEIPIK